MSTVIPKTIIAERIHPSSSSPLHTEILFCPLPLSLVPFKFQTHNSYNYSNVLVFRFPIQWLSPIV